MNDIITQKISNQLVFRSRTDGRFVRGPRSSARPCNRNSTPIKNGSLYSYKGQTVRALQLCTNGLRLVGFHGALFGFIRDSELRKINSVEVKKYLNK